LKLKNALIIDPIQSITDDAISFNRNSYLRWDYNLGVFYQNIFVDDKNFNLDKGYDI
jgi:hypothetical protein